MKLTITITGRNDGHSGNFIERLNQSVKENVKLMKDFDFDYEYLIIDWCSERGNCLYRMKEMQEIMGLAEVRMIVVPRDVVMKKFNCTRFYQFFAKNVGIQHAEGECVLLLNADNILNPSLIDSMNNIISEGLDNFFYRVQWWEEEMKRVNCDAVYGSEKGLAPIYSGDFLLCKKDILINKGRGYDEVNIHHQTNKAQAHMDGEILFNLRNNGVTPVILNETIYHIQHQRRAEYDFEYNKHGYENSETWGFADRTLKIIQDNTFTL